MNKRGDEDISHESVSFIVRFGIIFAAFTLFVIIVFGLTSPSESLQNTQEALFRLQLLSCLRGDFALETCFVSQGHGLSLHHEGKQVIINQAFLEQCDGKSIICFEDVVFYEKEGVLKKVSFKGGYRV